MDIHGVKSLYSILAVVGILVLAWFVLMFVVSRFSDGIAESYANARRRLTPIALFAAFAVAALAMAGSLYFSDIANYPPCTLCWYQRIAMYPLVLLLGIAAFRRDIGIRVYAIPLALIGAAISFYHYFLQWFPQIDTGGCSVTAPCTGIWFREFGFISIPFLALIGFLLIITFLLIPMRHRDEDDPDDADDADDGEPEDDDGEPEESRS